MINLRFEGTSDGTQEGIDRKKDGLCTTKQMKIKFEVEADRRGVESPKFAARTFKKDQGGEHSTPVMYVVHDGSDIDDGKELLNGYKTGFKCVRVCWIVH